ncbi:MAG: hypothetical protein K8R13_04695 [Methanococcoides sp.]|nr:hypothetical protein [Methanococcoides sp.]
MIAGLASAADTAEIRSPVFSGDNLTDIIANDGNSISFTDFAAFYYDIDDGVGSESITFNGTTDVIGEGDLVYTAMIQQVGYTYEGWDDDGQTYDKIGFLAEEYVPIDQDPGILSTLIMDDDGKYTIRIGEALDLGEGFALTPKQIDVDGNKVWLELSKDGKFLDDDVYNTEGNTDETSWDYEADVAGEEDVVIMRVHVDEVNQSGNFIIIEGLWLINDEVIEIDTSDTFDDLEVTTITTGPSGMIEMKNVDNDITLNDDSLISLSDGISIQTADPAAGTDALRFYFVKQITEPGTYEIRGTVAEPDTSTVVSTHTWTAANFAGFYYDIDDDISSETLVATVTVDSRTIAEDDLTYTAQIQQVAYAYEGWAYSPVADEQKFDTIGFLAEEYVPIDQDPGILSKLILDSDDKYGLRIGQTLELGEGFAITPKQIDVDGNKVWLELSKDGKFLDDDVYNTEGNTDETSWDYEADVAGEEDVVIMRVHVDEVNQSGNFIIIEGIWLISDEVMEVDTSDTFGDLEITTIFTGPSGSIVMKNIDNEITLRKDSEIGLTEVFNLKVADSEEVRFYPFMECEVIIENEIPTANISSILPNIADEGDLVTFSGTGSDNDGSIITYLWTSDLDGQLSTSENFSTSALSIGTHTVYFKVQDDDGAWSATDSATVTINELPNVAPTAEILSIDPSTATEGIEITFNGSGTDSDGTIISYDWNSSIDGQLSASESFSTSGLSLGTHTIYFSVQDDDSVWSATDSATVTINEKPNVVPFAEIISIDPTTATEDTEITFNGSGTDSDGMIIGYDWTSNLDGQLSTSENFSTSALSLGTHTIYFSVQDNHEAWSETATGSLPIYNSYDLDHDFRINIGEVNAAIDDYRT